MGDVKNCITRLNSMWFTQAGTLFLSEGNCYVSPFWQYAAVQTDLAP